MVISFVILIGPKSPEREPLVTAPTVVMEELPALSENLALASSSVKRSSNCVCIADDKPWTNSNSSWVVDKLLNLLISSEDAVTSVLPNLSVVVFNVPSIVTTWLSRPIKLVSDERPMLLPDITTLPALTVVPVTVPALTVLVAPSVISPNPDAIEPTDKAPTVLIVVAPAIGANCASAVAVVILVASWSFTLVAPIPLSVFNSAVVISWPSRILRSAALDVTAAVPRVNEPAVKLPLTVNLLSSRTSKFKSVLVPICEPVILIVPKSAEPDVTLPVVVIAPDISILVKPFTIEPTDKAPTFPNVALPVSGAYVVDAAEVSNLVPNLVLISYVTLANVLILSLVTLVTPSSILSSLASAVTLANLLISLAVAVTAVSPSVKLETSISPLTATLFVERVIKSAVVL